MRDIEDVSHQVMIRKGNTIKWRQNEYREIQGDDNPVTLLSKKAVQRLSDSSCGSRPFIY